MWANIFMIDRQILWNVETKPMFPSSKRLRMLWHTIWGQQLRSPLSALNCLSVPINALWKGIDSWLHSFCYYKTLINLLSSGTSWLETFPGPGSVIFVLQNKLCLIFCEMRFVFFFFCQHCSTRGHTVSRWIQKLSWFAFYFYDKHDGQMHLEKDGVYFSW